MCNNSKMHWDMFYYALTRNTINFLVVILFKDNKKKHLKEDKFVGIRM